MQEAKLLFLVLAVVNCSSAASQQKSASVPAAPMFEDQRQQSELTADAAQNGGSLEGVITDIDGAVVVGAHVVLSYGLVPKERRSVSDDHGKFSFSGIPNGSFRLSVTAPGLATRLLTGTVSAGEHKELDAIALPASVAVNVNVTVSQYDLAEEEIKVEEKQRIAGFIPNFFVAYDWKATPLTRGQKFELSWRTALDPASFLINGIIAGVEQADNAFSGYGQGAQG